MKKILAFLTIFFTIIFFAFPLVSIAQEAPEPPPDCTYCDVPFDNGVYFLVFFVVSLGIYKIFSERTKLKLVQ